MSRNSENCGRPGRIITVVLCVAALSAGGAQKTFGAPAFGEVFTLRQPDDTHINVRIWGDEFYGVTESLDGYTLVRDPKTQAFCYARLSADGNELLSTGVPVGSTLPAGLNLKQHIRINRASARAKIAAARARFAKGSAEMLATLGRGPRLDPPNNGLVKGITLLVDFSDDPGTILPSEVDNYCNQVGYNGNGNNGSVRDYFYDVSDGNLTYTNFVPTAYYRAGHPKTYYEDPLIEYGIRARELIIEALTDLENNDFDFSQYDSNSDGLIDGVNCFYAGYTNNNWAEGLWPHSWTVSFSADGVSTYKYQITDLGDSLLLGTFCHENGHMICDWPDLYDYGFESAGVGRFCLMCSSGPGTNPVEPCAYLKYIAGWSTTAVLATPQAGLTVPSGVNTSYKFEHPLNPNEYYMIENRQQDGRDSSIPDAGLAIWHIDTEGSNGNEQMTPQLHYEATLVQADGNWDLEYRNNYGDSTDLWKDPAYTECRPYTHPNTDWWDGSGSHLSIGSISPSAPTMTFDFDTLVDCNINAIPDAQDISMSTSEDCNSNVVPDECDLRTSFVSQSGDLSPIGYGSPQSYTVVSPPPGLRHVTLYFETFGDFNGPDRSLDVDINGTPVGSVFQAGAIGCPYVLDRDGIVVPCDAFNAAVAGGDAVINMVATSGVDPYACDSYIRMTVRYTAVGTSCNGNWIPDDCDIATETSDDCNTNAVPDECDTTGGGTLLDEDFESGLPAGWSVTGGFQITGQCGAAHPDCGGSLWAYAGDTTTCTYGDYEFRELIAPPVTLGYGLSELRFCSRIETEADWDLGQVRVNDTPVWEDSGGTGVWQQQVVDLGAFAGQTVTITFEFSSDSNTSGWLGWQVDNVYVVSGSPDEDGDGVPDECQAEIPTLSEWGMLAMGLLLIAAGMLVLAQRHTSANTRVN